MSLRTRLFGKKVEGEPLKNLLVTLGENPNKLLQTRAEKWSTREAHGRVSFTPTKKGLNVDLYIFRTDYHIKDGTLPLDNPTMASLYSENVLLFSNIDKKIETQLFNLHIQGEIKYNNVSQI